MTRLPRALNQLAPGSKRIALAGLATATLAATAAWVAHKARRAEQDHAPKGTFLKVDGIRVHYLDRGQGTPVLLLHGNAVGLEDFVVSGLIDRLAERYRVIAFDRPGYGHSERPRDRLWTPDAQAALVHKTFSQLGIAQPIVLGHSWGALVALALALRESAAVRRLVLISGYYFPTPRLDVALAAPPAVPVVGDIMRYTVSAVFARFLLGRTVKAMFAPQPVPADFLPTLSREMLVRPSQIRANAEDAAFMIPAAAALRKRYAELTVPTVIFGGGEDKVVDPDRHARQLHAELSKSELHVRPGLGHMLHHAVAEQVVGAVGSTTAAARADGARMFHANGTGADPVATQPI
jgi:pimeloyl-ACP methyl ester carboxylesterase